MFDSCDNSTFDDAPTVTPDDTCYYAGQGDLVVETKYSDSVSRTTGKKCGPYSINKAINSNNLTLLGAPYIPLLSSLDTNLNETHFKFFTN